MLVIDVVWRAESGPLRLVNRHGNEWHGNPGFHRYRNNFELLVDPGLAWLHVWCGNEFRADSDQARVNLHDLKLGVDVKASPTLRFRAYYDLESNRRERQNWEYTHVSQFMVVLRLPEPCDQLLREGSPSADLRKPAGAEPLGRDSSRRKKP